MRSLLVIALCASALAAQIDPPTLESRLGWLLWMEHHRVVDPAPWEDLDRRLFGPAVAEDDVATLAIVRGAFLRALGRVGDPATLGVFRNRLKGLGAPVAGPVAQGAAEAVALFGDASLLPSLAKVGGAREVALALKGVAALPEGPEARRELLELLALHGQAAKFPLPETLEACARVPAPVAADAVQRILLAKEAPPEVVEAALYWCARHPTRPPAAVRDAVVQLVATHPEWRVLAYRVLGRMADLPPRLETLALAFGDLEALPFVSARHRDVPAQVAAVQALATWPSEEGLDFLERVALARPGAPWMLVRAASETLANWDGALTAHPELRTAVIRALRRAFEIASATEARAAAAGAWARHAPKDFLAAYGARLRLQMQVPIAAAVARSLALVAAGDDEEGARALLRLRHHPDRRVAVALLEGLLQRAEAGSLARADLALAIGRERRVGEGPLRPRDTDRNDPVVLGLFARILATLYLEGSELVDDFPAAEWGAALAARIPATAIEPRQALIDFAARAGLEDFVHAQATEAAVPALRHQARRLATWPVDEPEAAPKTPDAATVRRYAAMARDVLDGTQREVRLETSKGSLEVTLFADRAPIAVANFLELAGKGNFDGILFHRVVPNFVAQAGCPRGDGWGGPGFAIPCENHAAPYERGTLGMALAGKDTGSSQWFFCLEPQPHLELRYTVFGQVTRGMEILRALEVGDYILKVEVH